jgi:DNA-binding MarR family transcriptional regulator
MNADERVVGQARHLAAVLADLDRVLRTAGRFAPAGATILSGFQGEVLALLAEQGPCSLREIGAAFGVTRPTVVQVLASLQAKGLIVRQPAATRRGVGTVALTAQGMAAQGAWAAQRDQRVAALLAPLAAQTVEALGRDVGALRDAMAYDGY